MSDAADFTAAFHEVKRQVQADVDPVLSYGDGVTPDLTKDLDSIIVRSRRGTTFIASATYEVGDTVFPITRNGRRYIVTVRGVAGATEPTFPDLDYGAVTSGAVTFEEAGKQPSNIYDIRRACYAAWVLKTSKASGKNQYLRDGRAEGSDYTYLNCRREAERYAPVAIA